MKCSDCGNEIDTCLLEESEVVVCSQCGLEMQYKNGNLEVLEIDGIDYGE